MQKITVSSNEAGQRLDKLLGKYLSNAPMSFVYKMLRKKNIKLNGKKAQGNEKLTKGDLVEVFLSDDTWQKFAGAPGAEKQLPADLARAMKSSIRLSVIYEDPDILILNKPSCMLSQKAAPSDLSLNEYMIAYLLKKGDLKLAELATFRPSVCNRLDRNTSGLVTAGKSLAGLQQLSEILRERTVKKYYLTIVDGVIKDRQKIEAFQIEILKHKDEIVPMLEKFCKDKKLEFRIPIAEVLDYCVLEYPFALWQWGTPTSVIPPLTSDAKTLFYHLVDISGPDYFAENQPNISFFVQAARELGYYGYDTKPFRKYLTIDSSRGYLNRIMLPKELVDKVEYRPELYHKVYDFLRDNDPKMIFIYGEVDPWSATRVPIFKGKVNEQVYIQPGGSHRARIGNMPEDMKEKILTQINKWLAE